MNAQEQGGAPAIGGVVDAVAAAIREHRWSDGFTSNCNCGNEAVWTHSDHATHVAAAVVEALEAERTIATAEQMYALPPGSIVVFADGTADQRGIEARSDGEWSWSQGALEDLLSVGPAVLVWRSDWRVSVVRGTTQ